MRNLQAIITRFPASIEHLLFAIKIVAKKTK